MIVAIDGPAGSGKSTTARAVAKRLGFHHLDSGALYRAVTWAALDAGVAEDAWARLDQEALDSFGIEAEFHGDELRVRAGGHDITRSIRNAAVTARVSRMASIGPVRAWVNQRLRAVAATTDVVAEGRDIGTVVFPHADLKIFLVADPAERARRRLRQSGHTDADPDALAAEIERLRRRDHLDSTRDIAPLRRADDAVDVDTTALDFDEQVERIVSLARS